MDFDRAIVKSLFFGSKPGNVLAAVNDEGYKHGRFKADLANLLSVTLREFTSREMEALARKELSRYNDDTFWKYPFDKIIDIGNKVMVYDDDGRLSIKDEHILRWSETTRYIGEDLFTCSYAAVNGVGDNKLLWPSPVSSTTARGYEASDIHFHIGSSCDTFDLTWIMWMNHPVYEDEKAVDLSYYSFQDKKHAISHCDWIRIAAIIRYAIFYVVVMDDDEKADLLSGIGQADSFMLEKSKKIYGLINTVISPRIDNGGNAKLWDYALSGCGLSEEDYRSPYVLCCGERLIAYSFFRKMMTSGCRGNMRKVCPYFFLYWVIKTHFRQEMVLANDLVGLKNFQSISGRKTGMGGLADLCDRYAVTTALETGQGLEARFSCPNAEKNEDFHRKMNIKSKMNLRSPFLKSGDDDSVGDNKEEKRDVTLVLSISKPDVTSKEKLLRQLDEIDKQINWFVRNHFNHRNATEGIKFVGLDFAGSDTKCRPFVLAKVVEKIRRAGCNNLTYHAGEDFMDLIDGLRGVDEVMEFLKWNESNRMGHCLSLFTDVENYYNGRHYNMLLTKQTLLDNLIWLKIKKKRLGRSFEISAEDAVNNKIQELFREIYDRKAPDDLDTFYGDARNMDGARYDSRVVQRGNELTTWKLPKSKEIISLIKDIQELLLATIAVRGIHIETCPTSNLLIGFFNKYIETPSGRLIDRQQVSASINTDIKGTVCTSLEKEYSLVRRSLIKSGKSESDVDAYLRKMAKRSNERRFL